MTTYSNLFTSQPLTAANLQRVIEDMADAVPRRLGLRPDILVVPTGLIAGAIHAGHTAVARLAQRLARPVITGRYEQRQRRRVQGVVAARAQRLQRIERRLVEAIETVDMLERLGVEHPCVNCSGTTPRHRSHAAAAPTAAATTGRSGGCDRTAATART